MQHSNFKWFACTLNHFRTVAFFIRVTVMSCQFVRDAQRAKRNETKGTQRMRMKIK